jgi:hypothetical protein
MQVVNQCPDWRQVMMFLRRHPVDMTPAELAALFLAADEARWLAEDHGLSS